MKYQSIFAWWLCWVLPFVGLFFVLLQAPVVLYLQMMEQVLPPIQTFLQSSFALYAPCGGIAHRQVLLQFLHFFLSKHLLNEL